MENVQKHSSERIAGREHFPVYPKGFIAVRIVQLVLAVICLGLCAYGVTLFAFSGDSLMLFTVCWLSFRRLRRSLLTTNRLW